MIRAIKNIMTERGEASGLLHRISEEEKLKLQQILLSMLIDIKEACYKAKIEFTIIGGSAIGAVRHKGFIPWDDDLDVAFSRKEWEKFKISFESLLGEKYALEAPNYNNTDSKQLLSKIYLKGTEYVTVDEMNFPYHNCIFVDLFVIDGVSNNALVRNIDAFVVNSMRLIAITTQEYRYPNPLIKKVMLSKWNTGLYYYFRKVIGFIFSWISHKTICQLFDAYVSRHGDNTKLVTVATGLKRYKGEMMARSIWFPYSKGEFCGIEVNLPHDVHRYLTTIYGNYMILPPSEKRETHSIVKLRF